MLLLGCQGTDGELITPFDLAPPPAPICETVIAGSATTCQGQGDWIKGAPVDCAGRGQVLNGSVALDTACGTGNYRRAKYTCCTCIPESQTGTCQSETAWRAAAASSCAFGGSVNPVAQDFTFASSCNTASSGHLGVSYHCCPAPVVQ